MEQEDVQHLEWIFGRMVEVHGEHEHFDYMNKFRNIIQSEKNRIMVPKLHNDGDIITIDAFNGMTNEVVITETVWDDLNGKWKYYFEVDGEDVYVHEDEIIKNND
jgi:hypothetical protein